MATRSKADRLTEIKDEIKTLMLEARDLLEGEGMVWERARSYWWAHIMCSLDHDHEFLSREMCTMESAVTELEGRGSEYECDDDSYDDDEGESSMRFELE